MPAASRTSPPSPAAELREEIQRIRQSLERLESGLQRMEEGTAPSRPRTRPDRYYAVLVDVYERGVHGVTRAQLGEIAAPHDYDRRGLGGFFVGARAPLQTREDRVVLTAEGHQLVHDHLESLHG